MPKKKSLARVVWHKFTVNGDKVNIQIRNTYLDKDFFDQDGLVSVNEKVQDAIRPSTKLQKLLEDGTIKNLKITYDVP